MSELELFVSEIDKSEPIQVHKTALNTQINSEANEPQQYFPNDATRPTSSLSLFKQDTESFLQTNRKRPANALNLPAKRGKTNPRVYRICDRWKLPKIQPISANNPNEFVKTVSPHRLNEIRQMRSDVTTAATQPVILTESEQLINTKSKYNWTVEEQKISELEKELESLEKLESKINFKSTLTDIKVTLITCTQCNYTAESPLRKCAKRFHVMTRERVTKSYFVCKKCDNVKSVYNSSYPKTHCGGCGNMQFIKSRLPMQTKAKREDLCVRGFEEPSLM